MLEFARHSRIKTGMAEKKRIYKPKPISGFPEWLPEIRAVEQQWLDKIRAVFERYGYCSIETPSVEELEVIAAKGEDVDKEIYVLERLQADPDEKKDARLALHFDQTVPFARYVAQHFSELTFPFKRYQMQRVWRGERPQMGRMREFTQCDIDVINVDHLPIHFDAEVAAICYEVLASLDIGRVQLRISNRKVFSGLLAAYELEDEQQATVFRVIDKIEKLSPEEFDKQLEEVLKPYNYNGVNPLGDVKAVLEYQNVLSEMSSSEQINFLEELIKALNETTWIEFEKKYNLEKIHYFYHDFGQGFVELYDVMKMLSHLPDKAVKLDLAIVRGLDYYTGTVYETQLLDVPEFVGSVCSGGRYDDLAGSYINKHLPGVGISIGFSRLFDVLRQNGKIEAGQKSPAHILMALPEEETRGAAADTARALRDRGYNVEQYHAPQKIGKQIAYAEKKGIPYIWFPFADGHKVKNLRTGDQVDGDASTWSIDDA